MEKRIYEVIKDGKVIFEGTGGECAKRLGLKNRTVANYEYNGSRVFGIYDIKTKGHPLRRNEYFYDVYDTEMNLLFTGNAVECREFCGGGDWFTPSGFVGKIWHKKYYFQRHIGKAVSQNEKYMLECLKVYGNTITPIKCDIEKILTFLKDEGLEVTARKSSFGGYVLEVL